MNSLEDAMPDADGNADATDIKQISELREVIGDPIALVLDKEMPGLDEFTRRYIELSPFLVIASVGKDGHVDVSPRGDPPGFVTIVDNNTILLPDRTGNKRADTMTNLLSNPQVSLIFFLPGYEETVRIRGRAKITKDPALLAPMAVKGKAPHLALQITIDMVFFHCAKAFKRSGLWDVEAQIKPGDFPRYAEIVQSQRMPDADVEEVDAKIQENYRTELY
jgi:PPOX class probable FMN-dependent enzyme